MQGELESLAYELSLRSLTQQEARLDELRARTATLLAASSLVSSFLGARTVERGAVGWLAVLALASFAISVVASVYVLLLKPRLIFSVRGTRLLEADYRDADRTVEAHRRLSYWLEDFVDANQPTVNRLFDVYRVAAVAVLIEVILWSVEVAV
jgi:hypothetical protein